MRRLIKAIVVLIGGIVLVVSLTGCADWGRPGASPEQVKYDGAKCRYEADAMQASAGYTQYALLAAGDHFNDCMRLKGYWLGGGDKPVQAVEAARPSPDFIGPMPAAK